jgi:uncharacterized protein YlxP (DUF503 family)
MFVGSLEIDLLLGDVRSLKQKRSVVRPIVASLARLRVAVAEVDDHDLHRRARIGVAAVAADSRHVGEILVASEDLVTQRPEVEVLSVRRRIRSSDDN